MEINRTSSLALFQNISTQLRSALGNIHLVAASLITEEERERDPEKDAKAALLDQSYYQLLRLASNLTATAYYMDNPPLTLRERNIVEDLRAQCEQAESLSRLLGVQLQFVCEMPSHVCAFDREAIWQLVAQLLSNALKFTPPGGTVTVELKCVGERLLLSVVDTGCGIPEKLLPTLFDRYRHKDLMDPQPHGVGLGLTLCRHIAESHGGAIMAESKLDKGSRITLSIPDFQTGVSGVSDVRFDYNGGFNPTLLALADALPQQAFLQRNQD